MPLPHRNQNIANSFWNLTDIFLYPVAFFCSASFFIDQLGSDQFGIWMLLNTIIIGMQCLNFGIGSQVFKSIAWLSGQEDQRGQQVVVNNALSITALLFLLCVLAAGLIAYLIYYHNLLHVADGFKLRCAHGVLMAGVIVGIKFFEQIFTNYFKALEQFDKAALLSSGHRTSALLLNILLLLYAGGGILQILTVIILAGILFLFVGILLLRKNLGPEYRFRFNIALPRRHAQFAFFVWLQATAFLFVFQADRYLVVNYFGLTILSYYALTATIFNHLHMGFNAILPWLSPKLTKRDAKNMDTHALYIAARDFMAACALVVLLLLGGCYPFLFRLVLGDQTYGALSAYVPFFLIFEMFFCLGIVPAFYFNALGYEKLFLYFVLFFTTISLGLMVASLAIFHTPVSVLYGLITSGILGMTLLNGLLSKVVYRRVHFSEIILLLIPPIVSATAILLPAGRLKISSGILALVVIYGVYVKGNRQQFKLLFRS